MRVLVCASEAPLAPLNGLRLQVYHLAEGLARAGHAVVVLAYRQPGQSGPPPPGVELRELDPPRSGRAGRVAEALFRDPAGASTLAPPMAEAARTVLEREGADVVHVTGSVLSGVAGALGDTPAVLGALDAWHLNRAAVTASKPAPLRPFFAYEERRVRRFTARAHRPYGAVVFVTEDDARAARALAADLRAEVIPNGVDAETYAPDPAVERDRDLVVLTGAMHYPPNVEAARYLAEDVMPRVRELRPAGRLALVGRGPAPEVRALASDTVEVTGEVPDVRPWLHRAGAFACLMRSGTGIKNKLLEAMAAGTPCVATSLACQGFDPVDGEHLLVADDPGAAACAIVRLLEDRALADRLGASARSLMVEHQSWDAVARRYAELYARVSAGGTSASASSQRASTRA